VGALRNDKRGQLLASTLRHTWPSEDRIAALVEAIRSDRALFKLMADLLPTVLTRKESSASVVSFVSVLFDKAMTAEGSEREFATATLARLGASIVLADRRTPNSDAALAVIRKMTRQLRSLTKGETARSVTWFFENLCGEERPADGTLCVNLQGARHIALAFEKADQGFAAKDILSVTARNLGLLPIGKKDDTAPYDPIMHEDTDGGLVPGEPAIILESGWSINHEAVLRAKVKTMRGRGHV
jgi:hypothetical protein